MVQAQIGEVAEFFGIAKKTEHEMHSDYCTPGPSQVTEHSMSGSSRSSAQAIRAESSDAILRPPHIPPVAPFCMPGPSNATKTVMTWTEDQTRFLLQQYMLNMEKVGPLKKFKNKKQMWENISEALKHEMGVQFSPLQVENRYKNVSKRNKDAVKNNQTSGSSIIITPYDKEMGQISAIDDSIEPEVIMTPTVIKRKRNTSRPETEPSPSDESVDDDTDHSATSPPAKIVKRDVASQLMEAYKVECQKKEERAMERTEQHREKMEKLERLNNLIEELVKKM